MLVTLIKPELLFENEAALLVTIAERYAWAGCSDWAEVERLLLDRLYAGRYSITREDSPPRVIVALKDGRVCAYLGEVS